MSCRQQRAAAALAAPTRNNNSGDNGYQQRQQQPTTNNLQKNPRREDTAYARCRNKQQYEDTGYRRETFTRVVVELTHHWGAVLFLGRRVAKGSNCTKE